MFNALVGIGPLISKYGVATCGVAACLVFAYFSPVFKKTALWAALCIGTWTLAYTIGVRDEHKHFTARWRAAVHQEVKNGNKARSDAERTVEHDTTDSVRDDECNRDKWRPGQRAC